MYVILFSFVDDVCLFKIFYFSSRRRVIYNPTSRGTNLLETHLFPFVLATLTGKYSLLVKLLQQCVADASSPLLTK